MEKTPRNSVDDLLMMFEDVKDNNKPVDYTKLESEETKKTEKKERRKSLSINVNDEIPEKRKRKSIKQEGTPQPKVGAVFEIQYQHLPNKIDISELKELIEKIPKMEGKIMFNEKNLEQSIVINCTNNGIHALIGNSYVLLKKELLTEIINSRRLIIVHNLMEEIKNYRNNIKCILENFNTNNTIFDTYIGASTIDPGSVDGKTFSQICLVYEVVINKSTIEERLKQTRRLAVKEVEIMNNDNMIKVFQEQEMIIDGVLIEMNYCNEFKIDNKLLNEQRKKLIEEQHKIEMETKKIIGRTINLSSPEQVKKELIRFNIGIDGIKKKATTDKKILSQSNHPFAKLVLEYRKISKLLSGVIEQIRKCCIKSGDEYFIRTTWSQTAIVTGRIQSKSPNLQQIPKQSFSLPQCLIIPRDLFITHNNNTFVAIDYNQIELRILADFTKDHHLIEFFKSNTDVHRLIAAHWLKKNVNDITDDERRKAKTIVYGCIYGIGPFSLADQLHVSLDESKAFLESFLDQFPAFKKWKEETITNASTTGFVHTINNRRRRINNLTDCNDKKTIAESKRIAVNSPIQGTAADIIKMCMIEIFKKLHSSWLGVQLLLNIHDEIVLEVPDHLLDEVCVTLKHLMEHIVQLEVPLVVTVETGKKWGSLHPYNLN
ncbi:hypothetical protein ENUP19_0328G0002 [Entamoeba nuttalli]|uniref:DNA-directed DNA polymerase n=2 Tax=Entamoeba nuttalli TaxID=412467 RepID=K2HW55_ENTNP|nr:DNA polymerase I domain containing protein [Entamoeba nuttalli P19]EKE40515.1 DNA polymerase I domain containing protein [Entamoeba nuttalli P19]|eukprot:XP_008857150.1 DNA polymerase I domain containing protein [Entamoeba nuttalli P19]